MKVLLQLEWKTVQHFSNTLEVEMPDELARDLAGRDATTRRRELAVWLDRHPELAWVDELNRQRPDWNEHVEDADEELTLVDFNTVDP